MPGFGLVMGKQVKYLLPTINAYQTETKVVLHTHTMIATLPNKHSLQYQNKILPHTHTHTHTNKARFL